MSTELATVDGPAAGVLALRGDQVDWTDLQRAAFAQIGIDRAPPADQAVFLHICQRMQLDPFARQIYLIERKERGRGDEPDKVKWTPQTAIDGFRVRAEDHPQYAGTLDPEWCGPDGQWLDSWTDRYPPVAARVLVLRHDREHHITLPVRFVEFAARYRRGDEWVLQGQWATKPAHMIQKVAEAAALRKAFPRIFSGVYIPEEMDQDNNHGMPVRDPAPAPRRRVSREQLTGVPRAPHGTPVTSAGATPPDTPAENPAGATPPSGDGSPASPGSPPPADLEEEFGRKRGHMFALFAEAEVTTRDDQLQLLGILLGGPVESRKLTLDDMTAAVDRLLELQRSGHADGLAGAVADLLNEDDLRRDAERQNGGADDPDNGTSH